MSPCEHDVTEREVAATADGLCPLCLQAEAARLRSELTEAAVDAHFVHRRDVYSFEACAQPSCVRRRAALRGEGTVG